ELWLVRVVDLVFECESAAEPGAAGECAGNYVDCCFGRFGCGRLCGIEHAYELWPECGYASQHSGSNGHRRNHAQRRQRNLLEYEQQRESGFGDVVYSRDIVERQRAGWRAF